MSRTGIDQLAGLPPQFTWVDGEWLFRRHGHGPAVRVTAGECAKFLRTGAYAAILHLVALALFGTIAWFVLERLLPDRSNNAVAVVFGGVLSLIGLALFGSVRHHADAPTRALAGRPIVAPARDPDDRTQPSYGSIGCLAVMLLFLAAIGTQRPASFYIAFASASVSVCVMLAVRRFLFDSSLKPAQRERLREREKAEREIIRLRHQDDAYWWQVPLLLGFVVVHYVLLLLGILLGVSLAAAISGRPFEDLTFGLFILGFCPGVGLGLLAFWPLERLCKRWTGASAVHAFDWVPAGW